MKNRNVDLLETMDDLIQKNDVNELGNFLEEGNFLEHIVKNGLVRETLLLLDQDVLSCCENKNQQMLRLFELAIDHNQPAIVEALLQCGAMPDFTGEFVHKTILEMARRKNRTGIVKILLEHGADIENVPVFGRALIEPYASRLETLREKVAAKLIEDPSSDFDKSSESEKNISNAIDIAIDADEIEMFLHQVRFVYMRKEELGTLSAEDLHLLRTLRNLIISLYGDLGEDEAKNIKQALFEKVIAFSKRNKKIIDVVCTPPYSRLASLSQRSIDIDPRKEERLSGYRDHCFRRSPVKSLSQLCLSTLESVMISGKTDNKTNEDAVISVSDSNLPTGFIAKLNSAKEMARTLETMKENGELLGKEKKEVEEFIKKVRKFQTYFGRVARSYNSDISRGAICSLYCLFSIALTLGLGLSVRPHRHRFHNHGGPSHLYHYGIDGTTASSSAFVKDYHYNGHASDGHAEYVLRTHTISYSSVVAQDSPSPDFSTWKYLWVCMVSILFFGIVCLLLVNKVLPSLENKIDRAKERDQDLKNLPENLKKEIDILKNNLEIWLKENQAHEKDIPFYKELNNIFEFLNATTKKEDLINGVNALANFLNEMTEEKQKETSAYDTCGDELRYVQSLRFFKPISEAQNPETRITIEELSDDDCSSDSFPEGKKEIEMEEIMASNKNNETIFDEENPPPFDGFHLRLPSDEKREVKQPLLSGFSR